MVMDVISSLVYNNGVWPVAATFRGLSRNRFDKQTAPAPKSFEPICIALSDTVVGTCFDKSAAAKVQMLRQLPVEFIQRNE